jgi:hypothetical protein
MTYNIYALIDPRDSLIRYIGQSRQEPKVRLHGHCSGNTNPKVTAWIAELKLAGFKPVIVPMQQVPTLAEAVGAETYWIRFFQAQQGAKLLNYQKTTRPPKPPKPRPSRMLTAREQGAYSAWETKRARKRQLATPPRALQLSKPAQRTTPRRVP